MCASSWQPVSLQRLSRVHSLSYIEGVEAFAAGGGGRIEMDTVVSKQSYGVALMAAGPSVTQLTELCEVRTGKPFVSYGRQGIIALESSAMGFVCSTTWQLAVAWRPRSWALSEC